MTKLTDRADQGYLIFQDHAALQDGTPLGRRQFVAAARIAEFPDPSTSDQPIRFGRDRQLGTLGDVHPWMFWQTRSRMDRAMGSWGQAFAGMVVNGDPNYGAAGVQPWRRNWLTDRRYYQKNAGVAAGMPWYPEGAMVIFTPGTDEDHQHEHAMWADPRLICPNAAGPGEMGTLVCDLGPEGAICMDRSATPGKGGRHARLQSIFRVIAVPEQQGFANLGAAGNVIALNFGQSGADALPNYGAAFGLVDGRAPGPITGGGGGNAQSGPNTGESSGAGRGGRELEYGDESIGSDPFGDVLRGESNSDGFGPADVGRFRKKATAGHGLGLMAAMGAMGPLHPGNTADKHRIGQDRDGHPINSMHISTHAYYYQDGFFDAPLHFEPMFYPQPPGFPNKARTHIFFDEKAVHAGLDGSKQGYWRLWTEIPDQAPKKPPITPRPPLPPLPPPPPPREPPPSGPPTQPPTTPPDGPTTPGPGGPGTPGPGGPGPGGPGGPGGGPTTPSGRKPGGPDIKPDPYPVGGGTTEMPPDQPGGKYYPGGGTGGGKGGDDDGPDDPGDDGPITGGGGGVGMCYDSDYRKRTARSPNDIRNSTFYGGGGGTSQSFQNRTGQFYYTKQSRFVGGSGVAIGTPGRDPREALGRWSGQDPWTREPESVPGLRERVGIQSPDDRGTYSLQRSLFSGFAAIAFRPQLWRNGYPNFERNPQLPSAMWDNDERVRPQSLVMRAWGKQDDDLGEYDYTERPYDSRARGGTVSGGVVFAPPRFEFEDYLGIGHTIDVEDTGDPAATDAHVLLAPGVSLSFGTPQVVGSSVVDANAVRMFRDTAGNDYAWKLEVAGIEALRARKNGSGDAVVETSPDGTSWTAVGEGSRRPDFWDDFIESDNFRWNADKNGNGTNFIQKASTFTYLREDTGQGWRVMNPVGTASTDWARLTADSLDDWTEICGDSEDRVFNFRVCLQAGTDIDAAFGLAQATMTSTACPSPGVCFSLITADDSNIRCKTDDDAGGTSDQDANVSIASIVQTPTWFTIKANSTSIRFYIDGNQVAEQSSDLPAGTAGCLSPYVIIRGAGTSNRRLFVDYIDYIGPSSRFTGHLS